ncbi:MAG: sugar ABC transporter ATP-binding protein [Anaerolineales bacterium]|nr:sugar ABC transporter ATP-binding protein [Anaerolineales bacterium]
MQPFLSLKNISKHYVGVTALDRVDFEIFPGEIHCLVGENGSGKSTLIKIISGVVPPDAGAEISIAGEMVHGSQTIDAIHKGIQIIYQDLSLFPNLTVAENIALGQVVASRKQVVSWSELHRIAQNAMRRIDIHLPLDALVSEISLADQQLVAICRAFTSDVRLLIMDEPTASLTRKEVDSLLQVVQDMRSKGIAIIFVSHKLDEVLQVADRVTVLRDGKKVGTYPSRELDDDKLVHLMTGKKVAYVPFMPAKLPEQPVLEVRGLSKFGYFRDISFQLYPGEILGLTGLLGSGRTELALALFGVHKPDSGQILFEGKPVKINSITEAMQIGISYVPEDRLLQGLVMNQSVGKNIVLTTLDQLLNRFKLLDSAKVQSTIQRWVQELAIKIPSVVSPVQTLSGGNQQRVVLAKWIATNPKVLILDGPTIGIDIAAKFSIHETIRALANRGIAILLISDEVPEVYQNANRILVMHKGRLEGEFAPAQASLKEVQEFINLPTEGIGL